MCYLSVQIWCSNGVEAKNIIPIRSALLVNCNLIPVSQHTPQMATAHDLQEQIEQLDLQILTALRDRVKLDAELRDHDDVNIDVADSIALWI